jgi:integrase
MPKRARELSALQVKRLTAPGRYAVGGGAHGLHFKVWPSGARSWVLRLLIGGKRHDLGLGGYPDVDLAAARERVRAIRLQIASGQHPLAAKQAQRHAMAAAVSKALTFDECAAQCIAAKAPAFSNPKHVQQWTNTLQTYASPVLGSMPVDTIGTQDVLKVLEPIWHSKTETATRVRMRVEAVLNWAAAAGHRSRDTANPARWSGHLDQLLAKPAKLKNVKHHDALPYAQAPAFMAKLRAVDGLRARALELLVLTASRSNEIRFAKWREFDLQAAVWTVPAERMKARKAHRVPLSAAAVAALERVGQGKGNAFLFANGDGVPPHENALANELAKLVPDVTPHGFRSTFKDWAREVCGTKYTDEASELALAHVSDDKTRAAYARGELLDERRKLMAEWAAYLEGK